MADFKMELRMDNAAFEDNGELPRILRDLAEKIDRLKQPPYLLYDINGNKVGWAEINE